MTVILLDGGIWNKIKVLISNFILLGGNYCPKYPTAMQSPSIHKNDFTHMTTTPTIIEKENVVDLQFPGIPIEKSKADMNKLIQKLRRSMVLGNIHRTKMRIIF